MKYRYYIVTRVYDKQERLLINEFQIEVDDFESEETWEAQNEIIKRIKRHYPNNSVFWSCEYITKGVA